MRRKKSLVHSFAYLVCREQHSKSISDLSINGPRYSVAAKSAAMHVTQRVGYRFIFWLGLKMEMVLCKAVWLRNTCFFSRWASSWGNVVTCRVNLVCTSCVYNGRCNQFISFVFLAAVLATSTRTLMVLYCLQDSALAILQSRSSAPPLRLRRSVK